LGRGLKVKPLERRCNFGSNILRPSDASAGNAPSETPEMLLRREFSLANPGNDRALVRSCAITISLDWMHDEYARG